MSRLKLFWPDESDSSEAVPAATINVGADRPATVLPFRPTILLSARVKRATPLDPVKRARVIHSNNVCPHCHHAIVTPIELQDAILNRNWLPIPGTATLVGFRCSDCHAEWVASPRSRSMLAALVAHDN